MWRWDKDRKVAINNLKISRTKTLSFQLLINFKKNIFAIKIYFSQRRRLILQVHKERDNINKILI